MILFFVPYYQCSTYPQTHWLVAIVATFFKLRTEFEFLFYWELEYLLANRELSIDIFL